MKICAEEFSRAGDRYLGRSYEEMDCQAFVEKCMSDCGYRRDLGGSNSWYRECLEHGWAGSPEACVRQFGSVPEGALLFILEPVSAKTPAKFRNDGIGDAVHMGICTGRGDGAIHSSSSRGCVCTSGFRGKTIPNGGWNRVGLLTKVFDYGPGVDPMPAGKTGGKDRMKVIIQAENGGPVKLRQGNDPKRSGYSIWEEVPSGTEAEVLKSGAEWSRIRVGSRTGWMMSRFLVADDGGIPAEPTGHEQDPAEESGEDALALLAEVYRTLAELCEKIESTVGVG